MTDGPPPSENERQVDSYAIASLFLAATLMFPISAVVAVIALVRIHRGPRPRIGGTILAVMALIVSVVVAPVAVVAAFNGRGPVTNMCVRVQQEARGTLRVVSYLQKGFFEKEGRYGTFDEIGFPLKKTKGPYAYTIDWADKDKFVASATGTGRMKGYLLQVDKTEKVNLVNDRCSEAKRRLEAAEMKAAAKKAEEAAAALGVPEAMASDADDPKSQP